MTNLFFILIWLFVRPVYSLISLALIRVPFGALTNNIRFSLPEDDIGAPGTLKAVSYNVQRFGLDLPLQEVNATRHEITAFLKAEDADFICLQEYHGHGKTLYEPLTEMKEQLRSATYYYESYFNPRFDQITGLVIFSKYRAISKGKLKFEGTRTFAIYTDLVVGSDTLRVYNIHLASIQLTHSDIDFVVHAGNDEEEFAYKAEQIHGQLADAFRLRARQLEYLRQDMAACPYPIILAGDFNDTPSSYVYRRMSQRFQDSFTRRGNGLGITYAGQVPFLRIDYIMHSDDFITTGYHRHRQDHSDHYPISATLRKTNAKTARQ